jgi:hypothetical protein
MSTAMLINNGVVENASTLLDNYDRDGFVFLESVLDARQVAEAQRGVAWAMDHVGGSYKWIKQRTYEWFREHPIFVELLEHPFVMEFADAVLGHDVQVIAAQCSRNTREPYIGGLTAIHQDACFFPTADRLLPGVPLERYSFSAMWYVQDTPLEMGPTELAPGLHRENRPITNGDLTDRMVWRRSMPAGSLLIFNHRAWHRGAVNHTDRPRDLITNAYARPVLTLEHLQVNQDGAKEYREPRELFAECGPRVREMLRAR